MTGAATLAFSPWPRTVTGMGSTGRGRVWGAALVCAVLLPAPLVGCASPGPSAERQAVPSSSAAALLVDVRTPQEFAAGHLAGAVNVPVESEGFAVAVAELAAGAPVAVYCRSGNRSAQAAALLAQEQVEVTDLGGYEQAAAETGLGTVR